MLSSARIYIFNVIYQNTSWLSITQTDQLSGSIANLLTLAMPDLQFKNIQITNVYDQNKHGSQIHINKITYKRNRTLSKEYIAEVQVRIKNQLKKISLLKFENVLVVNDEFELKSTPGLLIGDQNG